jgi:hypothetical protein
VGEVFNSSTSASDLLHLPNLPHLRCGFYETIHSTTRSMSTMIGRTMVLSALLVAVALPASAQSAERWWADVQALAHDSMGGRQTGSPEHRKAAEYVARAFRIAGLEPAGSDGFFQPVAFTLRTIDESRSSLVLVRDGEGDRLALGADASFMPRMPLAPEVEAPVVFAGYGLQLPEYGYRDLEGIDLRGKVVAYLAGSPKGVPGPVLSHARNQAWVAFRRAGAVGMIQFSSFRGGDSAYLRGAATRLVPAFSLADPMIDVQTGNRLAVQMNSARAERLFTGAPRGYDWLAARADSGLPLPHFDLPVRVRSRVHVIERTITSDNVVGLLRGSDPSLRDEYVVLTAHLDHVGVGRPVEGDSIYNGAMDNGSGSALLMEMARVLAPQRANLRRSVLLVAVTGEEKGLLGSRYFAFHPTVPSGSIAANLNTDMFLPIIPLRMIMANGLEESDLAESAEAAGRAVGVPVVTDPEPEENRFVRSDQYSFILHGIPALSVKVGFGRDTPEHQKVREFRARRYHRPADDTGQPVDLDAAAGFARFYATLVKEVANRETRPSWREESYFHRLAESLRTSK